MLCGSSHICIVPDPFGALCIADSRAPLLSQPSLPSACRPQPRHRQYPPLFVLCSSRAASIGFSSLSAFQTVRTTLKSKAKHHGFCLHRFLAAEDPLNGPFGVVIHIRAQMTSPLHLHQFFTQTCRLFIFRFLASWKMTVLILVLKYTKFVNFPDGRTRRVTFHDSL
jgi:hypothetical protein